MLVRLQKYLADCGVASRRAAEDLIRDGKVTVNGLTVTEMGVKIDDEKDSVMFCGRNIFPKTEAVYLMLHKPEGYVTTVSDPFGRPSALDLINMKKTRLFPVGRLDFNTSGLLLITNDGDLTFKLTHPKHDIEKTYMAKLSGVPDKSALESFRRGLLIDDYKTGPAAIEIVKSAENGCTAKIIIKEGKNRQVRKMCEAIGLKVLSLKRVATGKLVLGDLKKGEYRRLTNRELKYLKGL